MGVDYFNCELCGCIICDLYDYQSIEFTDRLFLTACEECGEEAKKFLKHNYSKSIFCIAVDSNDFYQQIENVKDFSEEFKAIHILTKREITYEKFHAAGSDELKELVKKENCPSFDSLAEAKKLEKKLQADCEIYKPTKAFMEYYKKCTKKMIDKHIKKTEAFKKLL